MSTTEQQAGSTEREAVETIARWLLPDQDKWSQMWRPGQSAMRRFNPFTNPTDERELLTAVQERWGRPACEDGEMPSARMWAAFSARIEEFASAGLPAWSSRFLLAYIAPGDIARAVDAVLRQYPESA